MSSRTRRLFLFVTDHESPNVVSQAALQATHRLVVALAGDDLGVVVGPSGTAMHPDLSQRDDVQGEVELPVSTAGQAVPGTVGAGDFDGGDSGVVGEADAVANRLA